MDLRYPTSHLQCFRSCIYIYRPNLPQENEHSRGKIAFVFIQDYTANNKCALAHTCTHTYLQAPVHTYTLQYKCACAHMHIFFKKEKKHFWAGEIAEHLYKALGSILSNIKSKHIIKLKCVWSKVRLQPSNTRYPKSLECNIVLDSNSQPAKCLDSSPSLSSTDPFPRGI